MNALQLRMNYSNLGILQVRPVNFNYGTICIQQFLYNKGNVQRAEDMSSVTTDTNLRRKKYFLSMLFAFPIHHKMIKLPFQALAIFFT